MPRSSDPSRPALQARGALWLAVDGQPLGERGRLGLLQAIAQEGSITRAAQAFGLSYKAAWDALDAMNHTAREPLVERVSGGKGGGSTVLTAYGQRLLERYLQVQAVHERYLRHLETGALDLDRPFSLLEVMNMQTSARNQWLGTVTALHPGAVNDEVEVLLPDGHSRVVATITRSSSAALGLALHTPVVALVKAPAVMLVGGYAPGQPPRLSARNQWPCRVTAVSPGAVNTEVCLQAESGLGLVAMVNQGATRDWDLSPGAPVLAVVQASDVVLATIV